MKRNTFILALGLVLVAPTLHAETTLSEKGSQLANDASALANQAATMVKDSAITANIYAQIALNKQFSKLSINVSTDKAVVSLKGQVQSTTEADELIQLASSSAGVKSVNSSQLEVEKSLHPLSDMMITAKVKAEIMRDKLTEELAMPVEVHVETRNAVVYLSGTSTNGIQTDNAIKVAQSVSGVQRVESTIKLLTDSAK